MEKHSQSELRRQMIAALIEGLGVKAQPFLKRLELPVRTPILLAAAEGVLSDLREMKNTEPLCKTMSLLIAALEEFGAEFKGF